SLWSHRFHHQPCLLLTHRTYHERYSIIHPCLPEPHHVKESLDDDQPLIASQFIRVVEIGDRRAFFEVRRQLVLALPLSRLFPGPAPGIGHQLPALIVNRYHHPTMHDAPAGMIAHPEMCNRLCRKATRAQVSMLMVKVCEGKLEWWVHRCH